MKKFKISRQFDAERLDFELNSCRTFVIKPSIDPSKHSRNWLFFAPAFMGKHPKNPKINPSNSIHPIDIDTPINPPDRPDRANNRWLFKKLLAAGFHIAGIEVGETYGNDFSSQRHTDLYNFLVKDFKLSKKPCLYAISRGGLILYNWAAKNPSKVCCIVGNQPVCDLRSYPGIMAAADAYGIPQNIFAQVLHKHNPIDILLPLAEKKIPIFHIHGLADTLVPFKSNTGELARRYKALGGKIKVIAVKNLEHGNWAKLHENPQVFDFIVKHS